MAQTGHCGMTEPGPDDGLRNSFYRKTTRSSRRMTPMRRLLYKLAVPLGLGIIKSWLATCRVVRKTSCIGALLPITPGSGAFGDSSNCGGRRAMETNAE